MRYLLVGLALGLGAGLAPGPLMALVFQTTLRRGLAAGLRVAAAPLLTDAPMIVVCVLVLNTLPRDALLVFGLVGGAYVIWLGVGVLRPVEESEDAPGARPGSDLRRGMLTNVLSPHPWLFWIAVGGPLLVTALRRSAGLGALLVVGIYAALVGTKAAIACSVAVARRRVDQRTLDRASRVSGVLLVGTGMYLLVESLTQLV
jgi:threonine/homoserine/homoserine lactone efflux protein